MMDATDRWYCSVQPNFRKRKPWKDTPTSVLISVTHILPCHSGSSLLLPLRHMLPRRVWILHRLVLHFSQAWRHWHLVRLRLVAHGHAQLLLKAQLALDQWPQVLCQGRRQVLSVLGEGLLQLHAGHRRVRAWAGSAPGGLGPISNLLGRRCGHMAGCWRLFLELGLGLPGP